MSNTTKPGLGVRKEKAYKALPDNERDYYENGDPKEKPKNQKKIKERERMAQEAARYQGKKGGKPKYSKDIPTGKDGKPDHEQIIKNVKKWVSQGLEPDKDPAATPDFSIDWFANRFTEGKIGPGKHWDPNGAGEGSWVCIDHAKLYEYILRGLGYPARAVNVPLSRNGKYEYQEAAVQVWYGGKWQYVDPYLCNFDPKKIFNTYGTYTDYKIHVAKKPVTAGDYGKYDKTTGEPKSPWSKFVEKAVERSGVYFEGQRPGVHFYISIDDGDKELHTGKVTHELSGAKIPNSFYLPAGLPVFEHHKSTEPLKEKNEAVFIGFSDLDPSPCEFGRTDYRMYIWSEGPMDAEITISKIETTEPIEVLVDGEPAEKITQIVEACQRHPKIISIIVGEGAVTGLRRNDTPLDKKQLHDFLDQEEGLKE